MGLSLISEPDEEPISLSQAKAHLIVETTAYDDLIRTYIKAARFYVEGVTRRALMEQTWDYTLSAFPCEIELPIQPVMSVSYVKYVNPAGNLVSFTDYDVLTDGPRTRIIPDYGVSWPDTRDHGNAVTVRFVAGYETVPEDILQAIKMLVAHFYQQREPVVIGASVANVPFAVDALLSGYELKGF